MPAKKYEFEMERLRECFEVGKGRKGVVQDWGGEGMAEKALQRLR